MKHSYVHTCECPRCTRERTRRGAQSLRDRTVPEVMHAWSASRNPRRARVAREYWDAYESGRPMSDNDR